MGEKSQAAAVASADRGGRPEVEVTPKELEGLAALQCTVAEAANSIGCSERTLYNRLRDPEYRAAWERGRARGKISLRRKQFRLADKDSRMAIHLGKNYLGQKDKVDHELSGPDGQPISVAASWTDLVRRARKRKAPAAETSPVAG